MTTKNIDLLGSLCINSDAEVRFRTVEKIVALFASRIASPSLIKLMTERLDDADELVRCASLEFFEDHAATINLGKCINMLKDKEAIVRAQAARVLGNINNDTATLSLIEAIKVAVDFEKVSLNFALFQLNPSVGLEPISKLLDSPDHQARCAAANLPPTFKGSEFHDLVIARLTVSLATDATRSSKLAKLDALNAMH